MDTIDIVREQLKAFEEGRRAATVTIVDAAGTTSRSQGKMLVYADGAALGTVGGGANERAAIADAVACIRRGENALRVYGDTCAAPDGKSCGDRLTMFIEVAPARPVLVVVGGGHVGGGVLRLGRFLGYETWLIDDREDSFLGEKRTLASRFVRVKDYEADLRAMEIPADAYVVLCTYSHRTDEAALAAMLEKETAYLGMLGSRKKSAGIFGRLEQRGFLPEQLRRVHTPIGLDLGGETPEEVALAILSEIQAARCGRPGVSFEK